MNTCDKTIPDVNFLFYKYYKDNPELRHIVSLHSEMVAKKALDICKRKKLPLDHKEVYCAAKLHDIGVVKCSAPGIHAKGDLPYICHGVEGEKILEKHHMFKYSGICSRHTGSGITKEEILRNNLPLPAKNYLPKTLMEKLICYADKFYSKSGDLTKEKSLEQIMNQMRSFGKESLDRFLELHKNFN